MELPNRHNIKSLVFDLSFDEERKAGDLYKRVRELHYKKIEQIISNCLDEFIGPERHMVLPRLELDLGPIPFQMMEDEMELRISRILRKELEKLRWSGGEEVEKGLPREESRLQSLIFYLKNGHLPWYEKASVEALMDECLADLPAALLQAALKNPVSARRLITRCSDRQVLALIRVYKPNEADKVHEVHGYFARWVIQRKLVPHTAQRVNRDLWLLVLGYLLRLGNAPFDAADFFRVMASLICEKYHLPFQAMKSEQPSENPHAERSWPRLGAFLLGQSLQTTINKKVLDQDLDIQLGKRPGSFKAWLFRQSQPEPVIRKIVRRLSEEAPIKLLRILEPAHHEEINTYRQNLISLQEKKQVVTAPIKEFSLALWEIILLILVKKASSKFNQKAFLKSLIEKTERCFQLTEGSLLEQLNALAPGKKASLSREPALWTLIREIWGEKHPPGQADAPIKAAPLLEPDVKKALLEFASENDWSGAVDLLMLEAQKGKISLFLLDELKAEALKKLLKEINPAEFSRIVSYADAMVEINRSPKWIQAEGRQLERGILGLAMRLLLEDKGSVSNQKFFLKRLIYEMARHYRMDREKLLIQLGEATQKLEKSGMKNTGFYRLLRELLAEEKMDQEEFSPQSQPNTPKEIASLAHVHPARLKQLYLEGAINHTSLLGWIVESDEAARLYLLEYLLAGRFVFAKAAIRFFEKWLDPALRNTSKVPSGSDSVLWLAVLTMALEGDSQGETEFFEELLRRIAMELGLSPQNLAFEMWETLRKPGSPGSQRAAKPFKAEDQRMAGMLEGIIAQKESSQQRPFAVNTLAHLLFGNNQVKTADWEEFGFRNEGQAMEFLLLHRPEELGRQGEKYSLERIQKKLESLSGTRIGHLLRSSRSKAAPEARALVGELERFFRSKGHHRITQVLEKLQMKLLALLIHNKVFSKAEMLKALAPWLEAEGFPAELPMANPVMFEKQGPKMEQEIFIQNAGLVILNGYLGYFFDRCGLVGNGGFKSNGHSHRAVKLLQYLTHPGQEIVEEELPLNKLICGIPIGEVVDPAFEPEDLEKEIIGQMFGAIISHWEMVKNSSVEGFRESWLWREGKLVEGEKSWSLTVEQRAFDVLLDYKPFSISPVSFSWMDKPIQVEWR